MNRELFTWKVILQTSEGEVVERHVSAYWDPEQTGCNESVMRTAKGEAWWEAQGKTGYEPISVSRVAG